MVRLLIGAVLGAVMLFAWGFVFWVQSGVLYQFLFPLPNEDDVVQALQKSDPKSGTYLIPFTADPAKQSDVHSRMNRGPVVEIVYRKEGVDPQNPTELAVGFCQDFAASLLAGVLLVMALPGLPRYPMRALFVTVLGAFSVVAIAFTKPVWFHHPWPAVLYESAYYAVGWLLAGLVMGLVIRMPREKPAAAARSGDRAATGGAATGGARAGGTEAITPPAAPPNP